MLACRSHLTCRWSHDWQSDEAAPKFCVRKPAGATFRKDSKGVPFSISLKLERSVSVAVPSLDSAKLRASGLETQPPGSAGKLSRPATVKLLALPPASAAQRWLTSAAAMSGFCPRGTSLPLAGETGDWMTMVPCWPNCDEAEMMLAVSGSRRLVVIEMFPPGPKTEFARI